MKLVNADGYRWNTDTVAFSKVALAVNLFTLIIVSKILIIMSLCRLVVYQITTLFTYLLAC